MTQDPGALAHFTVASGENITVTVGAIGIACTTSAALNTVAVVDSSPNPNADSVYKFPITGDVGTISKFACVCTFPGGAGSYTIDVTSDKGGNSNVPSIFPGTLGFNLFFTIQ
jgi:hypothetical protein